MAVGNRFAKDQDFEQLIQEIANVAGEYRLGEIRLFDFAHVHRWIAQFQVEKREKIIILMETLNLLKRFFLSRTATKECLVGFMQAATEDFPGGDIRNVNFIKNQPWGKSQFDLLGLMDEILDEKFGITTAECGESKTFLYIDDVIYSGSKFRYDIQNWAATEAEKFKLISYHILHHIEGYNYAGGHVSKSVASKNGTISPWRSHDICNNRRTGAPLQILWPKYFPGNELIDAYADSVRQQLASKGVSSQNVFRADGIKFAEGIFSSEANRDVLEQAFLEVGATLVLSAQNPQPSVRPMGVEFLATVGFGSPIITYRNIANNCPLALWYGDPDTYGADHPLGRWYPLFKRKN